MLGLVLSGCGGESRSSRLRITADTPIVLISIDTLRSDRLPAYGYDTIQTPAIDRLRADSILFEHAYSPIPLTLPAHASMLSGLLPPEHGVRDNVGYRYDATAGPHLPAILGRLGYETAAFVSSFVLRGASGLADDFDHYDDQIAAAGLAEDIGSAQRDGAATLEQARQWLRSRFAESSRPLFLFFHLYDPHTPYDPPEPFAARYPSPYDGEVAESDAYVGGLLDELESGGLYDRALIVLTSDHGESLGEHDYLEHGPFLYREAIQVPLIVKLPGNRRGGETIAAPAQLTDLLPTILTLLGQPVPAEASGSSLLELEPTSPRRLLAETFYPRLHFGWSDLASVLEYPHHYIHGPDPELYDLAADPGETRNLLTERRAVATALRRELERYDRGLAPPQEEDLETRQRLSALGYVGSTIADDLEGEGELPDPKARIHVLGEMARAVQASRAGRHQEAADIYRRIVGEEPRMIEAWQYLGAALLALDRPAEATDAYLEAVRLSGGASHLALAAASALLATGRLEEAQAHAELAAPVHPSAYDLLAQVAVIRGDLEAAERHLERVLAAGGNRVGPFITQAQLRFAQERYDEAIAASMQAEENLADGPRRFLRGAFLIRGDALAAQDRLPEARAAYETEIQLAPAGVAAYSRLAFIQAVEGDGPAVGATLRRLVETNPRPQAYAAAVALLRQIGDERSAAGLLRQALGRWPDDPELSALAGG